MIYEYECNNCSNIQDEVHGMEENPIIKCQDCGEAMTRIISGGSGVIFKGGDWPTADAKMKKSMEQKNVKQKRRTEHVKPIQRLSDL
jgi:putative FmdB family regulatory protein